MSRFEEEETRDESYRTGRRGGAGDRVPGHAGGGPGGFGAFESGARSVALSCCAEAMSRALEERDRELAASRPKGLRVHSRRPRALATMCGDVRFRRTVLLDGAGLTRYPCVSSSRFEQNVH